MMPMRGAKRLMAAAMMLLCLSAPVLGNGNTTADAPDPAAQAPVRKAVRKAPVKRPAKRPARKKTATVRKAAPKPPAPSSLDRGIALMREERYEAARPWLLKAVQENRRSALAWYWYGKYHEETGNFYQAQYFYAKALEQDPTFGPLSRVVAYPGDGSKTPLWDPKRPARVYPVPTQLGGVTVVPPDAPQARPLPRRPAQDPSLPRVPVYTPPEPGALPNGGDAWHPSVYVPPSEAQAYEAATEPALPVYTPPDPVAVRPQPPAPQPAPQAAPQLSQPERGAATYIPPSAPAQQEADPKVTPRKAAPRKVVRKQPAKPAPAPAQKPQKPEKPEKPAEPVAEKPAEQPKAPAPRLEELPPVGQEPSGRVEPPLPPVRQEQK